jgi:crotonobetainyl-CoA:carnitine CoA-transferase CaiB-like acyl-CoA transferase
VFPARDGTSISLGVVQDNQFSALCRAIARPDWITDPRFATTLERARPPHAQALREALLPIFASRDGLEWERLLNAVGAPCGLIRDVAGACDAARGADRGLVQQVDVTLRDGKTVTAEYLNAGFVFAKDGPAAPAQVAGVGQHSREILDSLHYSSGEIEALIAQGVIGEHTP